ncbi:hypothetical protein GCM10028819_06460 [Spirosoma humi]
MTLFESYVFNVSTKFISRASSQNQTLLINLLNVIGKYSSDSDKDREPLIEVVSETFMESPFRDLQQQWQEALTKPVIRQKELDEVTKERIHRAIIANQQQIDATLQHMRIIDALIARAKNMAQATPLQAQLLSHYRSVQQHYMAYLDQLKLVQERKISSLNS